MRKILIATLLAASLPAIGASAGDCTPRADLLEPRVVIALVDTGINPYAPAFRSDEPESQLDPCEYLPDPMFGTIRGDIDLDAPSIQAARDEFATLGVLPRFAYYFPGTRIVAASSWGAGGTRCSGPSGVPFAADVVNQAAGGECPLETRIWDEHGHGTMTASRAAGAPNSLAPNALLVAIEGSGEQGLRYAIGASDLIDVVSNSWGYITPWPTQAAVSDLIENATAKQMILFASGNGLGLNGGIAPNPTYNEPTAPPGVILVGAHDNGHVSPWSSAPAHVVADGYAGSTASNRDLGAMRPDPVACCTSAAAPYAAGGAAAILLRARQILWDTDTGARRMDVGGVQTWVVAAGTPPPDVAASASPLADGIFTMEEWRTVFLRTAEARPAHGRDDGWVHSAAAPGADAADRTVTYGPGQNPYCAGCYTAPARWADVPADAPAYPSIGYGAINERSVAAAIAVLEGRVPLPPRPAEDAFFDADQAVRRAIFR